MRAWPAWPADAGLLDRKTKGEMVSVGRLRAALEKLNASRMDHDALPPEAIDAAIDEFPPRPAAAASDVGGGCFDGRHRLNSDHAF